MAQIAWATVTAFGGPTKPPFQGEGVHKIIRVGAGVYIIDFTEGFFSDRPALVTTQQYSLSEKWDDFNSGGGDTRDNVVIIALDKDQAKVKTGGNTGDAVDRNFTFVAIGA